MSFQAASASLVSLVIGLVLGFGLSSWLVQPRSAELDTPFEGAVIEPSLEKQPAFLNISEIIMVVEDLDEAVARQWDEFGIGPWEIWTFDSSTVDDMMLHGERRDFSIRIAYAKIGDVYWELVQPLDQHSTYYETLRDHGPSVHNIVFEVADFYETAALMSEKGYGVFNSGNWQGTQFVNFDTRGALPVIAEIYRTPTGGSFPPPESVYPPEQARD